MSHTDPNLPPDLLEVARSLEADAPCMTETDFARVRRTALGRVSTARPRTAGPFTRSRVAITSMLAVGALMSTGGAALGVSALSTDLSARAAQYGTPSTQSTQSQTLTGSGSGTAAGSGSGGVVGSHTGAAGSGSGDVLSANAGQTSGQPQQGAPRAVAQAPRQFEGGGRSELPFTGYAAIPLLLVGLGLLAAGCVLRRGSHSTPTQA